MTAFRTQPYLQNPASDAMTITWFTDTGDSNRLSLPGIGDFDSTPILATALEYQTGELVNLVDGDRPSLPYKHSIRVTGLSANTRYDYSVALAPEGNGDNIFNATLTTAPSGPETVRFAVYADSETEPESSHRRRVWTNPGTIRPGWIEQDSNGQELYLLNQTDGYRENLAAIAQFNPDFVLVAGDLVESGGEQRDWDEFWRHNAGGVTVQDSVAGNHGTTYLANHIPILPALGNHENFGGPGSFGAYNREILVEGLGNVSATDFATDKYLSYFEVPSNGPVDHAETPENESKHDGRYYRLDYGKVTLITLDSSDGEGQQSNQDTNFFIQPEANAPDFNPGSRQFQWAQFQLDDAQAAGQTIFVQFHHAPFSSGPHGLPMIFGDPQSAVPMQVYAPLFEQHGVTAVFSGHDEMYEHSVVNGVHYYDIGIGGDGLRSPLSTSLSNPYQTFIAHADSPEVWVDSDGDGNIDQLLDGGKHYGHLQVEALFHGNGSLKQATFSPTYILPQTNLLGDVVGFETRTYNDELVITQPIQNTTMPITPPTGFQVTEFATVDYPNGMVVLEDGSLLVGTSEPNAPSYFFSSPGQLVLLTDEDQNGVAEQQVVVAEGLPPTITHLKQAGDLVFVSSYSEFKTRSELSVFRQSGTPGNLADPYALEPLGKIDFAFDDSSHAIVPMVLREAPPNQPATPELISTEADGAIFTSLADADNDGDLDIFVASRIDDTLAWYENLGGSFSATPTVISSTANGAIALITADLDQDGDPDAISASLADDTIAWYENTGGSFNSTANVVSDLVDGAVSVAIADLDNDNDLDIVSAAFFGDEIRWHENVNGSFASSSSISTAADGARTVATADLNGDGYIDVLSASRIDNKIAWYKNLGDGSFSEQNVIAIADGAFSVTSADLDGDGDLDVISASRDDDTVAWYENQGNETFGTANILTDSADEAFSVEAADLDSDGDIDLLAAAFGDDQLIWFENLGSGSFSAPIVISNAQDGPTSLAVADLDGDSQLDVVATSYDDDTVAWYEDVIDSTGTSSSSGSDAYELFFSLGSEGNNVPSEREVILSSSDFNLAATSLNADSIYKIRLEDTGSSLTLGGTKQIAAGLRNAADFAFEASTGDLYFIENGIDGIQTEELSAEGGVADPNEPLTADELNRIRVDNIGGPIENFGFANEGIRYRTGEFIDGQGNLVTNSEDYIDPVVAFQPLGGVSESEGPAALALAPANFPEGFNNGAFVGFYGRGQNAGLINEENPVLFYNFETEDYLQFIDNDELGIGHPITLATTDDALFVADLSANGKVRNTQGLGQGIIYKFVAAPEQRGTSGDDFLTGTSASEFIFGLAGNDTIWGGFGADNIEGNTGDDIIDAGLSNDVVNGGNGNDSIEGGDGDDILNGANDHDLIYGDEGNDLIRGGNGRDTLYGGDGNDNIKGGNTKDYVFGEAGNDRLDGNGAADELRGGLGNDLLRGQAGDDLLIGVEVTAPMPGNGERDRLLGGPGLDRFVLGDSNNVFYLGGLHADYGEIRDFDLSENDIIQLRGSASDYRLQSFGSGTRISLETGTSSDIIGIIKNVNLVDFNSGFDFV